VGEGCGVGVGFWLSVGGIGVSVAFGVGVVSGSKIALQASVTEANSASATVIRLLIGLFYHWQAPMPILRDP
jgi:hypothetical protein